MTWTPFTTLDGQTREALTFGSQKINIALQAVLEAVLDMPKRG